MVGIKIDGDYGVAVRWTIDATTLEIRGSNPVIGKLYWTFVYCQLYWKDENKEKRGQQELQFFKKLDVIGSTHLTHV